jgi:hypothetical protein
MEKRHASISVSARWFVVSVAAMLAFFLCASSEYERAPPPPPDEPYPTSRRPEGVFVLGNAPRSQHGSFCFPA